MVNKHQTRAARNIAWCERHLRLPSGPKAGQPFKMAPFMREDFRAIYDNPHGTRRAIISRGRKNAKTTECAMILLLHLVGPEAVPEGRLYSASNSQDQAAVVFDLAAAMVRRSPTLNDFVTIRDTIKELACNHAELMTEFKALSSESSTAFGINPALIIHDELGQVRGPKSRLYSALETAAGANNTLSLIISTQAATDADLLSVLIDDAAKGRDPRTVLRFSTADPEADPFKVATIRQANPAYDLFMNREEVRSQAADARAMPSQEAEYRNLILNQRIEVQAPYVSPGVWKLGAREVAEMPGAGHFGGLDLSASNDLTALVEVAHVGEEMHVWPTFWLPSEGLAEKARKDRVPYDLWAREGYLQTTPGRTVDYDWVAPLLLSRLRAGLERLAFDRWNMRFLKPALERAGATEDDLAKLVEFGQGFVSMAPALRTLDTYVLNDRLVHGGHPVLGMCAAHAVVKADPAGNRKLVKLSETKRIDGMVALTMAVATAANPEFALSTLIEVPEDYEIA
ncbi:MAG: terminase TerL endonuclease subunit [Pseudomonadota bacterium]